MPQTHPPSRPARGNAFKPLPKRQQRWAVLALTVLMLFTRNGSVLQASLPFHALDASTAVMLLGGYGLGWGFFGWFAALAFAIDFVAITFSDAVAVPWHISYAALLPAYAALWYVGRMAAAFNQEQGRLTQSFALLMAALIGSALSFTIANFGHYWSVAPDNPARQDWLVYATEVVGYFPSYAFNTLAYVALFIGGSVIYRAANQTPARAAAKNS